MQISIAAGSTSDSFAPPVAEQWSLAEPKRETGITPQTLRSYDPPTGWYGRVYRFADAWLSRLATRNAFWHRLFAWKFMPLAYRSGIELGRQRGDVYETVVPFRAFNKNWYDAMAGAALLANSEMAGGMLIFEKLGGDYTIVCKELQYRFRRPCLGPAIYRVKPREDVEELRQRQLEFNVTMDLEILQAAVGPGEKEKKVGHCEVTFHVAPKALLRAKQARFLKRRAQGSEPC